MRRNKKAEKNKPTQTNKTFLRGRFKRGIIIHLANFSKRTRLSWKGGPISATPSTRLRLRRTLGGARRGRGHFGSFGCLVRR